MGKNEKFFCLVFLGKTATYGPADSNINKCCIITYKKLILIHNFPVS